MRTIDDLTGRSWSSSEHELPLCKEDQESVKQLLTNENGFFTITFVKRGDSSLRTMNCRTGVTKHLKGGSASYNLEERNLVLVWTRKGYRSVPVENVISIKLGGLLHVFA